MNDHEIALKHLAEIFGKGAAEIIAKQEWILDMLAAARAEGRAEQNSTKITPGSST